MKEEQEEFSIEKISILLRKSKSDDGTFLDSLYNLYILIGITKGMDDVRNGRGITLEELDKEMEEKYESYNRRLG